MEKSGILIVDDQPANLKLLSFLLEKEGYHVRAATDASEALLVLQEFRPRLILMDLQLPGMDGFELTRKLKADPAHRGMVIVAVTASAMKGDEQKALDAGCDAYITKPIEVRVLPELISRYLLDRSERGASDS